VPNLLFQALLMMPSNAIEMTKIKVIGLLCTLLRLETQPRLKCPCVYHNNKTSLFCIYSINPKYFIVLIGLIDLPHEVNCVSHLQVTYLIHLLTVMP